MNAIEKRINVMEAMVRERSEDSEISNLTSDEIISQIRELRRQMPKPEHEIQARQVARRQAVARQGLEVVEREATIWQAVRSSDYKKGYWQCSREITGYDHI